MIENIDSKKFEETIKSINHKDLVCNCIVGTWFSDLFNFKFIPLPEETPEKPSKYKIGDLLDISITIDPYMRYDDLRILNQENKELLNLLDHGFNSNMF